jgi:hypothetical protein
VVVVNARTAKQFGIGVPPTLLTFSRRDHHLAAAHESGSDTSRHFFAALRILVAIEA